MTFFDESDNNIGQDIRVEITPLIDVIFLLLLFFLLTTTFITNPGIEVNLPKASTEELSSTSNEIVVVITDSGDIFFENSYITLSELETQFKKIAKSRGSNNMLIIQADEKSTHGKVVEVMDIAKKLGFNKLAIATQE